MQAMGLCGFFAQAFDLVLLIRIEVAFEPMPIAGVFIGTLPRKNMRGNAVKEHTVMAGDYCAAGERQQRFFETFERFYVQVVRGLVEKQQVAALLERKRQVQTVALAT